MAALADVLRPATSAPPDRPAAKPARFPRAVSVGAAIGVVAIGVVAIGAVFVTAGRSAPTSRVESPPTTMQLGNEVERGGHRWRVGQPGDIVLAGAFGCDGTEAPAIVRPSTGQVWLFDSWTASTGRLVGTLPGARAAGIRRDAACDRLEVRDGQGRWRTVG